MHTIPKRDSKHGKPPIELYKVLKTHGRKIYELAASGQYSERAINRSLGISNTLLRRAIEVLNRFPVEIESGNFDPIETFLFSPIGQDFKSMPFYQSLNAPGAEKPARQVRPRKRVGGSPSLSLTATETPAVTKTSMSELPSGNAPDVFDEFNRLQPTLARAKSEATAAPVVPQVSK
jgi:hypothetical protein